MKFFIIFLIAHFFGDYVFQPLALSEKKKRDKRYVALHCLIYTAISFLAVILIREAVVYIVFPIIIFSSHFLIDMLRLWFDRKFPCVKAQFASFIVDQLLHILILFLLTKDFADVNTSSIGMALHNWLARALAPMGVEYFLKLVLAYIIVLSPASIFIKHFFNLISKQMACGGDEKELCSEEENKTGAIIGKLERIVILTLGLMGLYTAIALVFTAKSIARFKQLDEREFAERYLIGTLLSFLIAILCILFVNMSVAFAF